jgi:hypothetical protein
MPPFKNFLPAYLVTTILSNKDSSIFLCANDILPLVDSPTIEEQDIKKKNMVQRVK